MRPTEGDECVTSHAERAPEKDEMISTPAPSPNPGLPPPVHPYCSPVPQHRHQRTCPMGQRLTKRTSSNTEATRCTQDVPITKQNQLMFFCKCLRSCFSQPMRLNRVQYYTLL